MTSAAPERHRFTVEEYHRMGDTGLFGQDDRVELVEGEIIDMTPVGSRHAACVDRLTRLLVVRIGERAIVRVQNPVQMGDLSEPQPDIAVLAPRTDFYAGAHPGPADVLLVVEVADTSIGWDRGVKVPMYGRAGVAEAWVVDVNAEAVDVWTQPGPDGYAETRRVARGGDLTAVGVTVTVDDILG
ncbi:MAG TPA: Uma2 family endonuclease [Acidimicrobiales bacterium]|nr:Uma2 family endonuclease [Acidimicrobiales bacterium]